MYKESLNSLYNLIEFLYITGQINLIINLILVLLATLCIAIIVSYRCFSKYGPNKKLDALSLQIKMLEDKLDINKEYKMSVLDNIMFKKTLNDLHASKGLKVRCCDVKWADSFNIELKSLPEEIQKLFELGLISSYTDNGEYIIFNPLYDNELASVNSIKKNEKK